MSKLVKQELRILGVDDGPFTLHDKIVPVICTVYRGKHSIDGLISFYVKRDGLDSTTKLIKTINESKHKRQLKVIMINGVALGGFNIVDLEMVNKKTGIPVIAVVNRVPDMESIKKAIKNLTNSKKRWALIEKLPLVSSVKIPDGNVYYQYVGLSKGDAGDIVRDSILRGKVPEPIRAAHLIASGIKFISHSSCK